MAPPLTPVRRRTGVKAPFRDQQKTSFPLVKRREYFFGGVSDGGFAKGTIDLGGLEARQVSTFAKVWSTAQGGQDGLGAAFFKPSPAPAGFRALGHYAQPNDRSLFGHVLVARDASGTGALLASPLDYTLVWSSGQDSGAGFFWLPVAPDGYRAVGVAVTTTKDKPSLDEIVCIRADFTDACEDDGEPVWSSDKGGFSATTLRPAVRGVDARGVRAGTFGVHVHAILAAYSPQVYLHPDDPYLPSSVPWYFENGAVLYQNGSQAGPTPVAADGSNLPQGGGNDGAYWLDLPVDNSQRERVKKGDLAGAKAYVQAKPMLGGTATDLALWFFYPFNGPARAKVGPLTIPLGMISEHVGDWEHITLHVSNFSGKLLRAYLSQHNTGAWVEAPQLQYIGNRPVVYASRSGHAFYPREGLVLQGDSKLGVGIRNDCAKGSMLDTGGGRCEVVSTEYLGAGKVAEPAWLGFERGWGPKEEYDIGREINRAARILPRKMRERLAELVKKLFVASSAKGRRGQR
uniref:Uncharacterized protein n=1 Tax=Avena sativa TaxID=4498 RepID=A0ACD5V2E3_AVESA